MARAAAVSNEELYRNTPISRAVLTLAVPTVISQIIHVLYVMADTFFIGQLGDTAQVAAATLSMPLFIFVTGIANLFGIGGASLISRSLGTGDRDTAKKTASFCIWSAGLISLLYGILILLCKPVLLPLLGAKGTAYDHCYDYLLWTITVGGLPMAMSACLAHLLRAEGLPRQAGFGMTLGGVLNILLDPLFLFGFNMDLTGAAIATMLSNVASLGYFVLVIRKRRGQLVINAAPENFTLSRGIPKEVLSVGLPTFAMNALGVLANGTLNWLMASYSDAAISGMGIAKRLDSLTFAVAMGMTQGVISLIGYNYAAKNYKRMNEAIRTTFVYTMILAALTTLVLFFGAVPVTRFFIDDEATVTYGQQFLKIICIICPLQTVSLMASTVFQAVGKKGQPLLLSFLRKGAVDVPAMLLLNSLLGISGIAWGIPIAELAAAAVAIILIAPLLREFSRLQRLQPQ